MDVVNQFKKFRKYQKGGFIIKNGYLYGRNGDGSETLFPFIKGSTYNKYKSSPWFMKTLRLAYNRYGQRVRNDYNLRIRLSGRTRPVTIKNRGTYNMPVEIFDKIVLACKIAGVDPKQGLAIAIKESSGYTDSKRVNTVYRGSNSNGTWSAYRAKNIAGPSTIVSNWQYFENSPYIGLLKGWENSGWDVNRLNEDAKYLYGKHLKEYDAYDANINEDILVNMFRLPLNKINSGEELYDETVRSYMQNMSYKYGGKL